MEAPGSERDLWQRAQAGDRKALDSLLRRHEKRVYRFGLRMCGDEEAAREVLQSTLLQAFRQLSSFRGDASMSTWLYAIARSFCSRAHRRTRSAPLHDVALDAPGAEVALEDETPGPAESIEKAEMAQLVAAAIGTLPPAYREVVVLRDVEGLTAEEAAQLLELQVPALKSRLHRARQELKERLASVLGEAGPGSVAARACPELARELAAFHDHEIDRPACAAIEAHLERCPRCHKSLGALRNAASLCKQIPGGDVPRPIKHAVRRALLQAFERGEGDQTVVHPKLREALVQKPAGRRPRKGS